ncbi:MAG: helix-turn-helix domain-containing protein, partial [Rubrivivax sp.]
GSRLLEGKEVWHVARSVAKWTWRHTSAEGFSDWQSAQGAKGGRKSGLVRRLANEDKRASARLMAAAGNSQAKIAAALGVTQQAVSKWLRDGHN